MKLAKVASGKRPWDTTLVKILGPSHLSPEEASQFGQLWPEGGNA